MLPIEPVVFNDDWGSRVSIASLQGLPIPSALPESELWLGAHESGPSPLAGEETSLLDLIAADPEATLGRDCVSRFGARLPYLFKILAPGRAISIQVHPTAHQAMEERARTGSQVYVDDWAKPELLLAISPFEVFVGLRERTAVEALVDRLGVPDLRAAFDRATLATDPSHAMVAEVLATPPAQVGALVRRVVAACVRVEGVEDEVGDAAAAIVRVAEEHPDDIGVVVLLLMHHRVLQPGEFIDVAAGVLHSYVRGLGIEVLANSDNVVRAGLTHKEVNVAELLRIVDPLADGVAGRPRVIGQGLEVFDSASDRFLLHRVDPRAPQVLPGVGSPRLAVALRGPVNLRSGDEHLALGDLGAAFLPAGQGPVECEGTGELYVVSVPPAAPTDGALA